MSSERPPAQGDPAAPIASLGAAAARVAEAVRLAVIGQDAAVETLLAAYLSGGHALIEGVPGIAKTLLARAFASSLGLAFSRVQFTPDLMPSDLVGTNVYDPKTAAFRLVRGPVFTEILMADEINRTPPKTQSALLEAMQERQVTIDGVTQPLSAAFFVIATQNPVEFEGTYPLPEAQLDRFVARVEMGIPAREAEIEMYRRAVDRRAAGLGHGVARGRRRARGGRRAALAGRAVFTWRRRFWTTSPALAAAVRGADRVEIGVSPRGGLALLEMARAVALLSGREFVLPDDVKRCLGPSWSHRILLTADAELESETPSRLLSQIAANVPVPR